MLQETPPSEREPGPATAAPETDKNAVCLTPTEIDFSGPEVEIKTDSILTFSPDKEFSLKRIKIENCKVEIKNLNLKGAISISASNVTLTNCNIHEPEDSIDYIVAAENNSGVVIRGCTLQKTTHFGVSIDKLSHVLIEDTMMSDVKLFGVVATGASKFRTVNCKFVDMDNDCLILTEQCEAEVLGCEFSGRQRRALTCNGGSVVVIDDCVIKNCVLSSLYVSVCDQFTLRRSRILDCNHTSVYLDQVGGVIEKTVIIGAKGNGVNVSHSSRCLIRRCQISKTTFPPIAICEGAYGRVNECEMVDSEMCGLIVRGGSRASIKNTMIKNVRHFGISASDSMHIKVKNCLIQECGEAAVAAYNSSDVTIDDSNFLASKVGINVFTGGFVNASNVAIIGMKKSAVWVHHAGAGVFDRCLVSTETVPEDQSLAEFLQKEEKCEPREVNFDSVVLCESKRPVLCTNFSVSGLGMRDFLANETAERASDGIASTPSRCKTCQKVITGPMFDRCGHIVYCQECWNSLEEKPECCEICMLPVTSVVQPVNMYHEEEEGVCAICFIDQVDSVILPCGHTICSACANQWFSTNGVCPFCREKNVRAQKSVPYE